MKLQLVAVGTKMPDWVQTGFTEYLRRFPKDMPFELIEIPAGKRGKNADIKRILDKEGEQMLAGLKGCRLPVKRRRSRAGRCRHLPFPIRWFACWSQRVCTGRGASPPTILITVSDK